MSQAAVVKKIQSKANKAAQQEVFDNAEGRAEQYPTTGYTVDDPADEKMELMLKLQEEHGGAPATTKYGRVQYDDDRVYKYLQKKADADVKRGFEQWFATNFDLMTPAHKAMARKLYPNFYRDRMATLKKNTDLLGDLARIRLMGVQSRDDLFLQYAADNGQIDMDVIENILHPNKPRGRVPYQRGLLNTRGRRGPDDVAQWAENRNRFGIGEGGISQGFRTDPSFPIFRGRKSTAAAAFGRAAPRGGGEAPELGLGQE